jgi:cephalosporin hydroxylase
MDYEPRLLPHPYLAELEPTEMDPELERLMEMPADEAAAQDGFLGERSHARSKWLGQTRLSPGYPAWNLLYYAILCSVDPELEDIVVIETGTNRGVSTIIMAAALKDLGANAVVRTVELNPTYSEAAQMHVSNAGLSDFVHFSVGDSHEFLRDVCAEVDHIDFAFLDADHHTEHVVREFELIHARVVARRGKVQFDNSGRGGEVAEALRLIQERFGGNLVEFDNCSWGPPGNAIWQPG